MRPGILWTIAIVMTLVSLFLFFFQLPASRTEMEKRGVKEDATLVLKDSAPLGDGSTVYKVMFVYPDAQKKSHSVWNQMSDGGLWASLEEKKPFKIYYLPDNPDMAIIPGADAVVPEGAQYVPIPSSQKRAGAMRYLAWSLLLFSLPIYYYAYLATKSPRQPKAKGPVIARR